MKIDKDGYMTFENDYEAERAYNLLDNINKNGTYEDREYYDQWFENYGKRVNLPDWLTTLAVVFAIRLGHSLAEHYRKEYLEANEALQYSGQ